VREKAESQIVRALSDAQNSVVGSEVVEKREGVVSDVALESGG